MERTEILIKLKDIFCDVLELKACDLNDESTADDIDGWDSLSHIQLVYRIQKSFRIKFTSLEILKWQNVGQMIDTIERKLR